jgi:hypothetical protein
VEYDPGRAIRQLVRGQARKDVLTPCLAGRTLKVLVDIDRHRRLGTPQRESVHRQARRHTSGRDSSRVGRWRGRSGPECDRDGDDSEATEEP